MKLKDDEKLTQEQIQQRNKEYNDYVEKITPTQSLAMNMLKAFVTGGVICTIGQCAMQIFQEGFKLGKEDASTWVSIFLILLSVILTGLNIYPKIAKFGGAGTLVPITGFANSIASPAIEFQTEGQVFGIGTRIFVIAGPVILYGIFASWCFGILYWILT